MVGKKELFCVNYIYEAALSPDGETLLVFLYLLFTSIKGIDMYNCCI